MIILNGIQWLDFTSYVTAHCARFSFVIVLTVGEPTVNDLIVPRDS